MFKQLKSLPLIDIFSSLSGQEVTHQTAVPELLGSITSYDKDLDVCFFCFVVIVAFTFLVQKTLFVMKCCNSFCNVNSFSKINIL